MVQRDEREGLSELHREGHGGHEREGLSKHHHKLHREGRGREPREGEQRDDTVGTVPADQAQVWVKERSPM